MPHVESDVVALRAFPRPVELQKWREDHHGRENMHRDRERANPREKVGEHDKHR